MDYRSETQWRAMMYLCKTKCVKNDLFVIVSKNKAKLTLKKILFFKKKCHFLRKFLSMGLGEYQRYFSVYFNCL